MFQTVLSERFTHRAPDLPVAMILNVMPFSSDRPFWPCMSFMLSRQTIWSPDPTSSPSRSWNSLSGSLSLLPCARRSRMNRLLMSRTCAFVPAISNVDLPIDCHLMHIWYASSSTSASSPQWMRSCARYSSTSCRHWLTLASSNRSPPSRSRRVASGSPSHLRRDAAPSGSLAHFSALAVKRHMLDSLAHWSCRSA